MAIKSKEAHPKATDVLLGKKKLLGRISEKYTSFVTTETVPGLSVTQLGTSLAKVKKLKLVANRVSSPMSKNIQEKVPPLVRYTEDVKKFRDTFGELELRRAESTHKKDIPDKTEVHTVNLKSRKKPATYLTGNPIENNTKFTSEMGTKAKRRNNIIIVNRMVTPYVYLTIQGMPREVEVNPEPTWAAVKSMGRNNPFYMYTGSEDTISFDISWYAVDKNREDVITKCRLLESWSKANGYLASPPNLEIIWGGEGGIFHGHKFILQSAKYILSNFQDAYKSRENGEVVDLKLLPNTATQTLIFKRVTSDNLLTQDILGKDNSQLSKVTGISIK